MIFACTNISQNTYIYIYYLHSTVSLAKLILITTIHVSGEETINELLNRIQQLVEAVHDREMSLDEALKSSTLGYIQELLDNWANGVLQ